MTTNLGASVHARLTNQAKAKRRPFQEVRITLESNVFKHLSAQTQPYARVELNLGDTRFSS